MNLTDFFTGNNNLKDEAIDKTFTVLEQNALKFFIVEVDRDDINLDINIAVVLQLINATIELRKLNETLSNLKLDNNLDQTILFDLITAVLRADTPITDLTQRYFNLVADIDAYADSFAYLNSNKPIEFDYSIDLWLLGKTHLLDNADFFSDKLESFFNLRYLLISHEIDYSEFMKRLRELI